jgi:hypothetical protein
MNTILRDNPIRAWHFVGDTLRDGRPVPKDGEWLVHSGEVELCASGLHASRDAFDALRYAPGSTLCLVECAGHVIEGDDKLVCSERKIVVRMDAERMLRWYARQQALSVVHLWEPPDVVLDYLMGDDSVRAAAEAAAAAAARAAAAWVAARAAAEAAAAARAAAAWAAARAAEAEAVEAEAARSDFNTLVRECFEDWL